MKMLIQILLISIVFAAKPDFGKGDWWIKHDDWDKYPRIKDGMRLFVEGCKFRLGAPKNERKDGNGVFRWVSDTKFEVEVANRPDQWRAFEKQADGSWREGREKHYWYITNLDSTEVNWSGSDSDCATDSSQFSTSTYERPPPPKKSTGFFKKCLSGVSPACEGKKISMNDAGWKRLTEGVVEMFTFLLKGVVQFGADGFSFTMVRAINSIRCAVANLGNNAWNILGAIYYAAKQFKKANQVKNAINKAIPYLCTCREEVEAVADAFGGDIQVRVVLGGCSELVQQQQADDAVVEEGGIPQNDSSDSEEDDL